MIFLGTSSFKSADLQLDFYSREYLFQDHEVVTFFHSCYDH